MVAVIDLGERSDFDLELVPRRPVDRRRLVRSALAAVTVLALAALGGSAWPLTHGPHRLWTVAVPANSDSALLDDDTVYFNDAESLTAYEIGTGAVRWKAALTAPVSPALPETAAGVILLQAGYTQASVRAQAAGVSFLYYSRDTIALDTATGRRVWESGAELADTEAGTAVLIRHDRDGIPTEARVLRLRDGSTVWSTPLDPQGTTAVVRAPGHPVAVVSTTGGGAATVRRLADGKIERTGRLPLTPLTDLYSVGGYLIARPLGGGSDVSTVHSPETLTELWHTEGTIADCGPVLCDLDSSGVTGRDPRTGVVLWGQEDVNAVRPAGDGKVLLDYTRIGSPGWTTGPFQLVDARTGAKVGAPVAGFLPSSSDVALVLHDTTTPEYSSAIVRLEPGTGRTTGIGTISRPIHDTCSARGEYLVCEATGQLVVTGLR